MTTATIRQKVTNYIQTADIKKVKAIYALLESEIQEKAFKWWEDEAFVEELDDEHKNIEHGKANTYSRTQINAEIIRLRKKRAHELQK